MKVSACLNGHNFLSRLGKCPECGLVGNSLKVNSGENKYHAVRTWSEYCQRWFASKAEASRGESLKLMQEAGGITSLQYQVPFILCKDPKITVTIDFSYIEKGELVYEDVKGVLTRDSRTKYAWLREKHRVKVRLVQCLVVCSL